jgi:hypothetical protein
MSLGPDDVVTLTEVLVILLGVGITWAIYYHSDRAELPGQATNPDPSIVDDPNSDIRGRSLS